DQAADGEDGLVAFEDLLVVGEGLAEAHHLDASAGVLEAEAAHATGAALERALAEVGHHAAAAYVRTLTRARRRDIALCFAEQLSDAGGAGAAQLGRVAVHGVAADVEAERLLLEGQLLARAPLGDIGVGRRLAEIALAGSGRPRLAAAEQAEQRG